MSYRCRDAAPGDACRAALPAFLDTYPLELATGRTLGPYPDATRGKHRATCVASCASLGQGFDIHGSCREQRRRGPLMKQARQAWACLTLLAVCLSLVACSAGSTQVQPAKRDSGIPAPQLTTPGTVPRPPRAALFAFGGAYMSRLAQIDDRTLSPLSGRLVRFGDNALSGFDDSANYVISPDARELAVPGDNTGRMTLVALPTLRRTAHFRVVRAGAILQPEVSLVSWPRRRMIIATSQPYVAHRVYRSRLLMIDPIAHKVVRRQLLPGTQMASGIGSDGRTVILMSPNDHVGPSWLMVITRSGNIHSVPLPTIEGGYGGTSTGDESVNPALLVHGETASVVSWTDSEATVDLRTLAVTEHTITGVPAPRPVGPAETPGSGGLMVNSTRELAPAGARHVLLTSRDSRPSAGGNQSYTRPTALIDTRTWSAVKLLPAADQVWSAHRRLYLWLNGTPRHPQQSVLLACTFTGQVAFRVQSKHGYEMSAGFLVRRPFDITNENQTAAQLLDPRTGRPIRNVTIHVPFQLIRWHASRS